MIGVCVCGVLSYTWCVRESCIFVDIYVAVRVGWDWLQRTGGRNNEG